MNDMLLPGLFSKSCQFGLVNKTLVTDLVLSRATEQMNAYNAADHETTTSVAPLLQFFELVHLGDTIQSIVQVYFDKELVRSCFVWVDLISFVSGATYRSYRFPKHSCPRKEALRECTR
jgi:hypothetical protein